MKLVSKICLIVAAFFALGSVAWAGFNYESLNNNFMIDSVLKSGGNYIMVGKSLSNSLVTEGATETSDFFAVSNNLIFLNRDSKFCTNISADGSCAGNRQILKENEIYDFKTKAVSINSSNPLGIYPKPGAGALFLNAQKITTESDLYLNEERNYSSLSFTKAIPPIRSIYAPIVSAKEIQLLGSNSYLNISSGTALKLQSNIRPLFQRVIEVTNNTNSAMVNYQVPIIIPAELLAADKLRSDGWDLRFYPDSGLDPLSQLKFFIDVMPKVWVQIPNIAANGSIDIYVTYGGTDTDNKSRSDIFDAVWSADKDNVSLSVSYNFDEDPIAAANLTYESSLFGPDGILVNNSVTDPMRVSGRINNGIKTFRNQIISLKRSIPLAGEWTIETWVRTPLNARIKDYIFLVKGSVDGVIAARHHPTAGWILGTMDNPATNGLNKSFKACDTNLTMTGIQGLGFTNLAAKPWHHLVAVGKGGKTTFYLDGISKPCVSPFQSTNNVIYIGNNNEDNFAWGAIDEFRVYNNALSEEKIAILANNCSITTLALPGKVLVKKCLATEPAIEWKIAETCLEELIDGNDPCINAALLSSNLEAKAQAITYNVTTGNTTTKKNFCYVESLDKTYTNESVYYNFSNITARTAIKTDKTDDDAADNCQGATDVGDCKDSSNITTCARRACCQPGYYVFDFNASSGEKQEMVCCRYNPLAPGPNNP